MSLGSRRILSAIFLFVILLPFGVKAEEWLPVSTEDLQMKDFAARPGAPAVILYRRVEGDDNKMWEKHYVRIKILRDEGMKYANVETAAYEDFFKISDVKARVIQVDGSIVPYTGQPLEKVAKYKSVRVLSKSFVLPDVRIGSIIEYQYRVEWEYHIQMPTRWLLEADLYTREAHFSFKPLLGSGYAWTTFAVGEQLGASPRDEGRVRGVTLDIKNVEPFEREPMMPPEREVRSWVQFYYVYNIRSAEEFWSERARANAKGIEAYLSHHSVVDREVASTISTGDSTEQKLRKLYSRVRQVRNISYEQEKTAKEGKREKYGSDDIDEVIRRAYGAHWEMARLMVAFARAAGFEANVVRVAERDYQFFHREIPAWSQLNDEVAYVRADSKDYWFDPGTPFCPFGVLPWEDTSTTGLKATADGGVWVQMPDPKPEDATQSRVADLQLASNGSASGELVLTLDGRLAFERRLDKRFDDDAQRKKDLQNEVEAALANGAKAELIRMEHWNDENEPLVLTFKITLPNLAAVTGSRMFLPVGIFTGEYQSPLTHKERYLPIYFSYPFTTRDEVNVSVPGAAKVASVPDPRNSQMRFGTYGSGGEANSDGKKLHFKRSLTLNVVQMDASEYGNLRKFYSTATAADQEQAIIKIGE